MNIQEEETSNFNASEQEQEEYSDEQYQAPKSENFLLNYEEQHPDAIIQGILIDIFNYLIRNKKGEFNIKLIQNKIINLCLGFSKNNIILWLLKLIGDIIRKLKGKILEIPKIKEFQENNIRPLFIRKVNYSQKKYSNKSTNNSNGKNGKFNNKSCPKKKSYMNFNIAKTLFNHIKLIKCYLINAAPIIEEAFEYPLSEFEKFSILECEIEDYLKIIIHDDFIWEEIITFQNTEYDNIIQEITEGNDRNIRTMTNKIKYFSQEFREICSGLDERYPEDAKPIIVGADMRLRRNNLFQNQIIETNNNEYENDHDDIVNNTINEIKEINNTSVREIKVFKDIHSINKNINKINFEKNFSKKNINNSIKISSINETNINSIGNDRPNLMDLLNKEKSLKNKINKNKKANNNKSNKKNAVQNKNYKIDKKEIPSDIDDLVKYIEADNKNDTQTKKKKKNKKKAKKKNKKEEMDKKEENMNEEELKQKKEDDEINEIKENLLKNSINRFKIHKIKFKYKKEWLEQISKDL